MLGALPGDWRALQLRHGLRHFVCVPLCSGEVVVGVLTLAAREGERAHVWGFVWGRVWFCVGRVRCGVLARGPGRSVE